MLIFRYKKVANTFQKSLALRLCSDNLITAMSTKPFIIALLIGTLLTIATASTYAGRAAKPATGTPPPPVVAPEGSPR
jgi:hypothetical protein